MSAGQQRGGEPRNKQPVERNNNVAHVLRSLGFGRLWAEQSRSSTLRPKKSFTIRLFDPRNDHESAQAGDDLLRSDGRQTRSPASEGDRLQNGRRLIGFGGAIRVRSIAPIASPSFWKSRFSRLTICRGVIYATRPPHNATQLQLSYSKK